MTSSNGTHPNGKSSLDAIRRRRQRAEETLRRTQQRERELLVRDRLERHPHYQQLSEQATELRRQLHHLRINMARKRLSIRSHEDKIRTRHEELADLTLDEQQRVAELERIERQLEQTRQRMLEQLDGSAERHGH